MLRIAPSRSLHEERMRVPWWWPRRIVAREGNRMFPSPLSPPPAAAGIVDVFAASPSSVAFVLDTEAESDDVAARLIDRLLSPTSS
ncbi:hypothetical protein GW17_00051035 [Ensete ventricosum]|nr:hypothetical protein GW17_00051035 [Ensete ventricosum]